MACQTNSGDIIKISHVSEEKWAEIYELRENVLKSITNEIDVEAIRDNINKMWNTIGFKNPPELIIADSPTQMIELFYEKQGSRDEKPEIFYGYWLLCWYAFLQAGVLAGAKLDEEKMEEFGNFITNIQLFIPTEKFCIVCKNPVAVHFVDGELHNDSGLSVEYVDGTGLYSISGVGVDEQIVLRPETQTIQDIDTEDNAEVKRIRIERYGWLKYLEEKNAIVLEHSYNEIEQVDESLMVCDDMKILVCACPSTARVYALEVDPECATIEEAQNYLSNGKRKRIIGAS